jgi:hypothetical protein
METVRPARLSAAIASLHETRSVDLSRNPFSGPEKIDAEGASALADALKANTSVANINLSRNKIGVKGASALADALKVNSSVTEINLSSNRFGVKGAAALADALTVTTSVTEIDLRYNTIGDEGASALADALEVNMSLTKIDLSYNGIGNEGAVVLIDALQVNTSLTCIDLDNNAIGESNRASFNALISRNKRLRSLFLFDARHMLLSLMCADECGVVWPYLLKSGDTDGVFVPDNVDTIRAELLVLLRSVDVAALPPPDNRQVSPGVAERDARAAKRQRTRVDERYMIMYVRIFL